MNRLADYFAAACIAPYTPWLGREFWPALLSLFFLLTAGAETSRAEPPTREKPPAVAAAAVMSAAQFLPADFAHDGSKRYQAELQQAIDAAAKAGLPLVFPAATYQLDERGLQLRSGSTLWMQGARFELGLDCSQDGQAFLGHDVSDIQLVGGDILGHNEAWPIGVNIRGIYLTGKTAGVHIRDTRLRELSSTGIGIFGSEEQPARDVWVTDVVIDHCCNTYADYLEAKPGPEKGSKREDQGLICCYYVHDFVVRGCRFENSRSDGTHFYRCRQGHFTDNRVIGAKMGGYFLETCQDVVASGNLMRDNGSRGVTIERGSTRCTLQNCLVATSGREGAWLPDCTGLVISGNVFDRNGQKANLPSVNGPIEKHTANICIDQDAHEPTHSPTADYLVTGNLLYTGPNQRAAIRLDAAVATQIVVKNNLLRGDNPQILVDGQSDGTLVIEGNSP